MKSFVLCLFVLSCLLVFPTVSKSETTDLDLSYGQLAQYELSHSLADSLQAAGAIKVDSLPHEGKSLRKIIGRFRDMIDIFAYALPATANDAFFTELRLNLDTGYEQVGYFKDLFDVQGVDDPADAQYDSKEVNKLLKPVLRWQKSFLNESFVQKMSNYIAGISSANPGSLKKSELSKFYWKQVGAEPAFQDNARDSLRDLVKGLLKKARQEEKVALNMDKILRSKDIETFHDFRKRVRAVVEICQYFPEIFAFGADDQATLALLDELVSRYGDLHDNIIRFERAEAQNEKKKAKKLEVLIDEQWSTLKKWQNQTITLRLLD